MHDPSAAQDRPAAAECRAARLVSTVPCPAMRTLPRLTLIRLRCRARCAPRRPRRAKSSASMRARPRAAARTTWATTSRQALIEAASFGATGSTNTINISAGTYTPANAGTGFVYNGTQRIVQIIDLGNDIDDNDDHAAGHHARGPEDRRPAGSTITDVQVTAPNTTTNGANFAQRRRPTTSPSSCLPARPRPRSRSPTRASRTHGHLRHPGRSLDVARRLGHRRPHEGDDQRCRRGSSPTTAGR